MRNRTETFEDEFTIHIKGRSQGRAMPKLVQATLEQYVKMFQDKAKQLKMELRHVDVKGGGSKEDSVGDATDLVPAMPIILHDKGGESDLLEFFNVDGKESLSILSKVHEFAHSNIEPVSDNLARLDKRDVVRELVRIKPNMTPAEAVFYGMGVSNICNHIETMGESEDQTEGGNDIVTEVMGKLNDMINGLGDKSKRKH